MDTKDDFNVLSSEYILKVQQNDSLKIEVQKTEHKMRSINGCQYLSRFLEAWVSSTHRELSCDLV